MIGVDQVEADTDYYEGEEYFGTSRRHESGQSGYYLVFFLL